MSSESPTRTEGVEAAPIEGVPESRLVAKLSRTVGKVTAVVQETGREQVTLMTDDGRDAAFAASAMLVEQAVALQGQSVVATSLESSRTDTPARLLRLDTLDADLAGDAEERLASLAEQWSDALEALSK